MKTQLFRMPQTHRRSCDKNIQSASPFRNNADTQPSISTPTGETMNGDAEVLMT